MSEAPEANLDAKRRSTEAAPWAAIPLSEERRRFLAPQWEVLLRTLRRMDELDMRGCEPAGLFAWRSEQ